MPFPFFVRLNHQRRLRQDNIRPRLASRRTRYLRIHRWSSQWSYNKNLLAQPAHCITRRYKYLPPTLIQCLHATDILLLRCTTKYGVVHDSRFTPNWWLDLLWYWPLCQSLIKHAIDWLFDSNFWLIWQFGVSIRPWCFDSSNLTKCTHYVKLDGKLGTDCSIVDFSFHFYNH